MEEKIPDKLASIPITTHGGKIKIHGFYLTQQLDTMAKSLKRTYRIGKFIAYQETLWNGKEMAWSFLGSFLGIGLIAFIQERYVSSSDQVFLIGSFGATSVLIYGVIQSPLAQPRNLVGGHLISAIVGVSVAQWFPDILWITAPLAVSTSIIAMQFTKTLHPPGGATALIAVAGSDKIKALGYFYVVFPVMTGVLTLLLIALIVNNLTPNRQYPISGRIVRVLYRVRGIKREP